ncbi:MAG: hypothetical protein V3T22_06805, partial [Planctomycetota bacterium]
MIQRVPLILTLAPLVLALPIQEREGAQPRPPAAPDLAGELQLWRAQHGDSWRVRADRHTGYASFLFSGRAESDLAPDLSDEWFATGRAFLTAAEGLLGIEGSTLRNGDRVYLPLSRAGSTDKVTLSYHQQVSGVPVVGGRVNVLLDPWGTLLSIQSTASPALAQANTTPTVVSAEARRQALALFEAQTGLTADGASLGQLVFVRVERGELVLPTLAWQIDVNGTRPAAPPEHWRFWIDAAAGGLLDAESLVHNLDVTGTVTSLATPGVLPDTGSNPPTPQAMPYIQVTSSAGTVQADADGNFVFAGINSPLDVTFEYVGPFNDVRNDTGPDYSLTVQLPANQANSVLMNPAADPLVTSQANAYLHINLLRDWVRAIVPSDATADFQAISNCNLAQTCNAFFNGGSINFFLAGGNCPNTAYSTVVAHEQGHWLNVLYGTGNGSDGMGEGNSDVFAMYLYDTPIVGEDFCGSGCDIRDGNNTRQYCGDGNGGCYGGVHADGEVWMGAAWKVRSNLNATHGDATGDLIADTLFLSWMNAFDQTQIDSVIETQWLTLDDDDGDIGNGTPNYFDIDSGFRAQGFPGFPAILFSNVTDLPDTQDETGPYVVGATIVAGINPPIVAATLRYRVDGGAFVDVALANVGGDDFQAA